MRTALIFLLLTVPALADDTALLTRWDAAYYQCKMGETKDGVELSEKEIAKSCAARDADTKQIKAAGYCWDQSEAEWSKDCK